MEQRVSFSLQEFVEKFQEKKQQPELFDLENPDLLAIKVDGRVWIKVGSMVAYRGEVHFGREGDFSFAEGKGAIFCSDQGKNIFIISLENGTLFVQGNSLLAFEKSLKQETVMIKAKSGMLRGGHHYVKIEGTGRLALSTFGYPITMKSSPSAPVFTDPDATVAWTGAHHPEVISEAGAHTLFKGGSGEINQYHFKEDGVVFVQPYEEHSYAPATGLHAKT